jgi:uncharacterized protein YukE
VLVVVILGGFWALAHTYVFYDNWRLLGYQPAADVSNLADNATFTDGARRLFYVNHPEVTPKQRFSSACTSQQEQTIVLGCYHGVQRGIYILKITDDSRLEGVMEVTAAHEMLHAAYDRLSAKERQRVDGWLTDYYEHGLTDARVKKTIESYKQTEPNALVNEMHSIFGTEIVTLPTNLEHYYTRYFHDRKQVTGYAADYQAEFTSREQQVAKYDKQLQQLKNSIDTNENELKRQLTALRAHNAELTSLRNSGKTSAYNAQVPVFNRAVNDYNRLADTVRSQISQYNRLVEARNRVAFEQRQLAGELSGDDVSTIPKQ